MAIDPRLRERALAALRADKAHISGVAGEDRHALLEELNAHQIELEMQNEELRASQQELQVARDRYAELYDFAPVAYLTLAGDDTIQQANLTATALFGKTRSELVGSRWSKFLHHDDQDVWYLFRTQLLDQGSPQDCELRITAPNGGRIVVVATRAIQEPAGTAPTLFVSLTDVTERRTAEQKLQASEQQFQSLLASLDEVVWLTAADSTFLYLNQAAERVYGVPLDVCMADRNFWLKAIVPEDREIAERTSTQLFERGHAVAEYRIQRPDGSIRWLLDRKSVVKEGGEIIAFAGVATDITERKLSENSLRESEERYRQLVDNSPFCVHELAMDGTFISMNRTGLQMMGLADESKIRGVPYLDAVRGRDKLAIGERLEQARQGHASSFEFETPTGQAFDSCLVPLTGNDGEVSRIMGITQDITKRKRAEERLRQSEARYADLYENAPDMMLSIAVPEGTIAQCNQTFADVFGQTKEQIIGSPLLAIYAPESAETVRSSLRDEFRANGQLIGKELTVRCNDGTTRDVILNATSVRDEHGVIVRSRSVLRDVTAIKIAQERLRQREAELEHVSRASSMGEMALALTHELNQPLGTAATYAGRCIDLLETETARPGELLEPLRNAYAQVMRAGEIIAKLKSFVSKSMPKKERVDLNDLVRKVDELVPRYLPSTRVTRLLELHPHSVFVMADALQIEQVLVNLMTNALHSISESVGVAGKVVIRVTVTEDCAEATVIDNGEGIAGDQLDRVFEPYQTSKLDGLGMGLSICRTIISNHGGRIWATNNETRGATFTFSLPLPQSEETPAQASAVAAVCESTTRTS